MQRRNQRQPRISLSALRHRLPPRPPKLLPIPHQQPCLLHGPPTRIPTRTPTLLVLPLLTLTAGLRLPRPRPRPRLRRTPPRTRAVHCGPADMQHPPQPRRASLWTRMARSQTLRHQGLVACRVRLRHQLLETRTRHESVGRCSMQIHTQPCGHL